MSRDALEQWRKKGERGLQPYASFLKAYEQAELECEETLIRIWKEAAPSDWRAAKEMLSKRFPARWSEHAARLAAEDPQRNGLAFTAFNITIHLEEPPGGWFPKRAAAQVTPAQLDALKGAKDEV